MRTPLISLPLNVRFHSVTLGLCLIVMFGFIVQVKADGDGDNADAMLENLKRRSAEERWQRIKRLHPAEPAMRSGGLARRPDRVNDPADDGVPPSPGQTTLTPRLTVFPADKSSDWVLPARPLLADEGAVVPAPTQDIYTPSESNPTEMRPNSPTRLALQDTESTSTPESPVSPVPASPRNILSRKMGDINPYYDRTNDSDIREYADEKIKEYEWTYEPGAFHQRSFPQIGLNWEPSNLTYKPLYFADPALERYGHSYNPIVQPFASIARFGTQFILLPYQMTIQPICSDETPLGWYRPGDVAPKLHYQIPLNAEAAVVEAAFITGLFFVIQ